MQEQRHDRHFSYPASKATALPRDRNRGGARPGAGGNTGRSESEKVRRFSPSQSKMKVSTESMRSSASWRGCAEAPALRVSILGRGLLGSPLEQKLLLLHAAPPPANRGGGDGDGGGGGGTARAAEGRGTAENNLCDGAPQLITPLLSISPSFPSVFLVPSPSPTLALISSHLSSFYLFIYSILTQFFF